MSELRAEVERLRARVERHKAALNVALSYTPASDEIDDEDIESQLIGCSMVLNDQDEP